MHNLQRNPQSAQRYTLAAALLAVLAGLAAVLWLCGGGALTLLGLALLAGQPDAVSAALLQEGRFDSGSVALRWQPEDLELLAEDAIAELQPLCQAKGVSVQMEMPGTADVHTVLCDAFWLGEALGNILKNCIEQTPPGNEIRLGIEYTATQTRILVFDPGSFLPEDTDIILRVTEIVA